MVATARAPPAKRNPPGLDPNDALQCQPLKSAWRTADAAVKAGLGATARGEEAAETYALSPEKRLRVGGAVERAFGFRWPANLCPDDALLGKLERFYHKKYRFTPRIQETRNVLERGTHASKVLAQVRRETDPLTEESFGAVPTRVNEEDVGGDQTLTWLQFDFNTKGTTLGSFM